MDVNGKPTLAYLELQAIRKLAAFRIIGATQRKLNQFAREYTFPDGSILLIKRGKGESYIAKGGICDCVSILRVNSFGKATMA